MILLLSGVGWLLVNHTYATLVHESFRNRSLAYVQAFASSSAPWLDPTQPTMLQSAARFMLVGSALYVLVILDGQVVVDERVEAAADLDLNLIAADARSGIQIIASKRSNLLDIAVPIVPSEVVGRAYVRMGIDTRSVQDRLQLLAFRTGLVAAGIDIVLIGLLWWIIGSRVTLPQRHKDDSAEALARSRAVGALRIDLSAREVTYRGHRVMLTPKQFALVAFLATDPGHVFSETEIVADVWETSSYADAKDVKQYVYLVRQRLAAVHPDGKRVIRTVPGFGYTMDALPVDDELTES